MYEFRVSPYHHGNCFRKFWNYKENGKLIYETDR